jgi:hypothetical protein
MASKRKKIFKYARHFTYEPAKNGAQRFASTFSIKFQNRTICARNAKLSGGESGPTIEAIYHSRERNRLCTLFALKLEVNLARHGVPVLFTKIRRNRKNVWQQPN